MGTAERPDYAQQPDQSLAHLAQAQVSIGRNLASLQLESEARFLHLRFVNEDLSALPDYMGSDWVVPGVGDAGAHVSLIMDAADKLFYLALVQRHTYLLFGRNHSHADGQAEPCALPCRSRLAGRWQQGGH